MHQVLLLAILLFKARSSIPSISTLFHTLFNSYLLFETCTMKLSTTLVSVFVCVAAAGPPAQHHHTFEKRQSTANDLKNGGCKKNILIFARASTEGGNMVRQRAAVDRI
jgi:hypothetical protein